MFLEVERKFCPSAVALIAANAGFPRFNQFTTLPVTTFTDTYFDLKHSLRDRGVWLRRRDNDWEMKVRTGGDLLNSSFQEITCPDEINQALRKYCIHPIFSTSSSIRVPSKQGLSTLTPFARFTTTREAWTAQSDSGETVQLVVDTADFGHKVGEVEIAWDGVDPAVQEASRLKMDQIIAAFMARHQWAFPEGECKGKLTAYLERQMLRAKGSGML